MYQKALAAQEANANAGPNHPGTLMLVFNIGNLMIEAGICFV
jgi:hypothetical protein